MNNIGYAFIGTPKGLQTKNGGIIDGIDIGRYIDLDGNVIKVDPNTELFSIRKVLVKQDVLYFITQYEYAKEIESHRTGTFFGCTLVLKNSIAPAEAILLVLSELMASLREYIRPDGRFATTLERIPLKDSKRLQGLETSLKPMPNKIVGLSNQNLFVHLKGDNDFRDRVNFIHQCLNSKNFEAFSTVYASEDRAILNFVRGNKTMRTATIGMSYETKLEKMEARYQALLQKVEKENGLLGDLTTQKVQLTGEVDELSGKQQTLSTKYKDTETTIVSNLGKLQQLEKSLSVSVKSLEQQQQTAEQQYKNSIGTYDTDVTHFQVRLENLQASNKELETEQTNMIASIQQLKQEKGSLQKGNQKLMDDFELIRHNAKQSELEKQEILTEQGALAAEKTKLKSNIQQLAIDKTKLQARNEQLMNEFELLKEKIKEATIEQETARAATQRLATEQAVLKTELKQLQQTREETILAATNVQETSIEHILLPERHVEHTAAIPTIEELIQEEAIEKLIETAEAMQANA